MVFDFKGRDLISINELSREDIDYVLSVAEKIDKNSSLYREIMKGKIMAPLFFEPSTRTFSSFQSAMIQMSGNVLDFDVEASSIKKGETLKDTARIIEGYKTNIVVVRHRRDGSARLVADVVSAPVINAGDGQNQHPTQTLLDLYTIKSINGKIDGIKIALVGDIKYGRTVHSLSIALTKYEGCEVFFISPDSLRAPKPLLEELRKKGLRFEEFDLDKLKEIVSKVDILYMTRIQRERFPEGPEGEQEYAKVSREYRLTKQMLDSVELKANFKIMHPLPKVTEIEPAIDETSYAYYFKQAENGLYVRKALLLLVTGEL